MNPMTYSEKAVMLAKNAEGLRLAAYQDSGGIWTIGYGHTGSEVFEGLTITEIQAEKFLEHDLINAQTSVNALITVSLSQNQFDALVDFVFNLGAGNLKQSTLLRLLNSSNFSKAALEFPKWIYQNKKVLPGLVKRRRAEMDLFNSASI